MLPTFYPNRVAAGTNLTVSYEELQQKVLPSSFYTSLPGPYNDGTYVWGYKVGGAPALYPGFNVEAQKGTATQVTYLNHLGTSTPPLICNSILQLIKVSTGPTRSAHRK